jgi:hypothetical protein
LDEEKSKHAGFGQQNLHSLNWLVKGATQFEVGW